MKQASKWVLKETSALTREQLEPAPKSGSNVLGVARGVILSEVDTINQNGRMYERREFETALEKYNPTIVARKAIGELDHPLTAEVERNQMVMLQNVSHVISECGWQGRHFKGAVEFLDTPAGKIAHNVVEAGIPIGTSSRGFGELVVEAKGSLVRDYEIVCWDIVSDPSVQVSEMRLKESAVKAARGGLLMESRRRLVTGSLVDVNRILEAAHRVFGD
tara:strand:+ start:4456 stop:5112 length:657 start_codon:yes stop_codon:yes gene_type:complete